ncbi:hypothetical protein [Streptomyces africanus]|uniref:hypothetical protein n=1 Tax=Streptomyces africanus TaxID=231024 RepID=UPI000A36CFBD|nr:hypothetical protein [Streptomyces africanus]
MPSDLWLFVNSVNTTVPITLASATEDHSIRFHQYHLEDMGSLGGTSRCGTNVLALMQLSAPWSTIQRATRLVFDRFTTIAGLGGFIRPASTNRTATLHH